MAQRSRRWRFKAQRAVPVGVSSPWGWGQSWQVTTPDGYRHSLHSTRRAAVEEAKRLNLERGTKSNPARRFPYTVAGMAQAVRFGERLRKRGLAVRIIARRRRSR